MDEMVLDMLREDANGGIPGWSKDPELFLDEVQADLPALVGKMDAFLAAAQWKDASEEEAFGKLKNYVDELAKVVEDRDALRSAVLASELPQFYTDLSEQYPEQCEMLEEEGSSVAGNVGVVQAYSEKE